MKCLWVNIRRMAISEIQEICSYESNVGRKVVYFFRNVRNVI